MTHILLISGKKSVFSELGTVFLENTVTTRWTDTGQDALSMLSRGKFDLFITDEQLPDTTARDLIEKALFKDAMMNCVVLSTLSHNAFHEAYEGLGVLMQFPPEPGEKQARALLDHLDRIARIAGRTSKLKEEKI